MSDTISVVVPSQSPYSNSHPSHQVMVYAVARDMTNEFGGATAIPGQGFWLNDNEEIIREDVTVVTTHILGQVSQEEAIAFIKSIATTVKDIMKQESVMYKYNNTVYFLE